MATTTRLYVPGKNSLANVASSKTIKASRASTGELAFYSGGSALATKRPTPAARPYYMRAERD
jgi:hypothetical protein